MGSLRLGRKCSDLGVGGWVSCNPNIMRICKSVQNILDDPLVAFVLSINIIAPKL